MKSVLKQHIVDRLGRVPDHLEEVLACFSELETSRQEFLLRAGEVCKYVYFIVEGCLQVLVVDEKGGESTREFYFEEQWTTDIFGFRNQVPSNEFIRCVEPCRLLRISYEDFGKLVEAVPEFMQVYQKILEVSYNNTVYRLNTFTSMDALQRIQWLQENQPRLLSRLSARMVASYLGISPETFTRLRGKA